jgi:hypothetical protein
MKKASTVLFTESRDQDSQPAGGSLPLTPSKYVNNMIINLEKIYEA